MQNFERIVEEAILKAIENGEFKNLKGIGKPIVWKENSFISSDMRLVDELLKKNDILYPWMEKRKEIEKQIQELREIFIIEKRFIKRDKEALSAQITSINKKIFDYNLSVPVDRFQRRMLSVEEFLPDFSD